MSAGRPKDDIDAIVEALAIARNLEQVRDWRDNPELSEIFYGLADEHFRELAEAMGFRVERIEAPATPSTDSIGIPT